MIKVNDKMLDKFINIMDEYGEVLINYEDRDYLKKQLEAVLNFQGYWSGVYIRVYYNKNTKDFRVENRF